MSRKKRNALQEAIRTGTLLLERRRLRDEIARIDQTIAILKRGGAACAAVQELLEDAVSAHQFVRNPLWCCVSGRRS